MVDNVYKLLQKLQVTSLLGRLVRHPSSGRRRNARAADNIDLFYELVLHKNGKNG